MGRDLTDREVFQAAARFRLDGALDRWEAHGSGHINDTLRLTTLGGGKRTRYILQRINPRVFPNAPAQIDNIDRVLSHLRSKERDPRRVLSMVIARDGTMAWRDPGGAFWRVFNYIEEARTSDVVDFPEQAYEAAKVFGRFMTDLTDFKGSRLTETIQDFHNTPKRLSALERAAKEDPYGRASEAEREIEFSGSNRKLAGLISGLVEKGEVPERIVHNDTKISNVLFDESLGKALCVIDLDTVMPGSALYDFGDLVRTSVSPARDDEKDLAKADVRVPVFKALARGYLESAGEVLSEVERANFGVSGAVIAYELGLRFLTDFLTGDSYFKTSRPGQNLDRCRTQFHLAKGLLDREAELQRIVDSV